MPVAAFAEVHALGFGAKGFWGKPLVYQLTLGVAIPNQLPMAGKLSSDGDGIFVLVYQGNKNNAYFYFFLIFV